MKSVNIKGKEYIPVNERIKYFNKNYPNGSIKTEIVELNDKRIIMKAVVVPDVSNPERYFTGFSYETENSTFINKTSFIENCETSVIGRALGTMGIGIDNSIASAEEVKWATEKQEHSTRPNKTTVSKGDLTENDKKRLIEIGNMLMDICDKDKLTASSMLKDLTSFNNKEGTKISGKSSISLITSSKQTKVLYQKVLNLYQETMKRKQPKTEDLPEF